jgi:hypothetical protein
MDVHSYWQGPLEDGDSKDLQNANNIVYFHPETLAT